MYSADETIEKAKGAIRTSKYMEDGEKKTFLHRLAGISRSWSESHGVSPIIKNISVPISRELLSFVLRLPKLPKPDNFLGTGYLLQVSSVSVSIRLIIRRNTSPKKWRISNWTIMTG